VLVRTYGVRNRDREPVSLHTRFRIASVTKMVTAIGLMRLYEQGAFDLDAPLSAYMPMRVANPSYPDEEVTMRQVLSHTSSIKTGLRYKPNWEKLKKDNRYFKRYVHPGTRYMYANLNGGLCGAAIEALSGQSVNTYMRENVFAPLGIDAAYNPGLLLDQSDMADMMGENGRIISTAGREIRVHSDYDDTCDPREHTDRTAGGLYISPAALSRLMAMFAGGGETGGVRILSSETVTLMRQDQSTVENSSVRVTSPYGLFVTHVTAGDRYVWYGHQGRYNGLCADAFYQPETGFTFVMVVNGYDGPLSDDGLSRIARKALALAESFLPGQ